MKPDQLVTIAEYTHAAKADIDLSELEAAGIKAFLQGDNSLSWMPNLAMTGALMQLQVAAADVEKALKIIQHKDKPKRGGPPRATPDTRGGTGRKPRKK